MITIDFSNPAQMACLSFGVALVLIFTLVAGVLVGKEVRGGVVDLAPCSVFACIFIGIASTLYHLIILVSQHL